MTRLYKNMCWSLHNIYGIPHEFLEMLHYHSKIICKGNAVGKVMVIEVDSLK